MAAFSRRSTIEMICKKLMMRGWRKRENACGMTVTDSRLTGNSVNSMTLEYRAVYPSCI